MARKIKFDGVCTCDGKTITETGERKSVTYNYYDGMPKKELERHEHRLKRQIKDKQKRLGIVAEEQPIPVTYIYFTRMWDKVKELSIEQAKTYVGNGYKVFALDSNGITYSVKFQGLELTLNKED